MVLELWDRLGRADSVQDLIGGTDSPFALFGDLWKLLFSPPCGGRCHGVTEGGSAEDDQIGLTNCGPPSAFGISPRKGGEGNLRICIGLRKGGEGIPSSSWQVDDATPSMRRVGQGVGWK